MTRRQQFTVARRNSNAEASMLWRTPIENALNTSAAEMAYSLQSGRLGVDNFDKIKIEVYRA
jgi:hypothetical protein